MALKISIPTDFGISAVYWRISRTVDHYHGRVEVVMAGYPDQDIASLHKAPLSRMSIFVQAKDAARSELYPLIKQQEPFVGAEDV